MFKKYAFAFSVCLLSSSVFSQTDEVTSVLLQIEENNKELQAYSHMIESKQFESASLNSLDNLEVSGYYLPFGDHNSSDYSEIQVSQSFEFPTVYAIRGDLINNQKRELDLNYFAKKQEILLSAKKQCIEVISLNKKLGIENKRLAQAHQVFENAEDQFEKEQIGILAFNKAKTAWLQVEFNVQKIELQKRNILARLTHLNGGSEVRIGQIIYGNENVFIDVDSLWAEKQRSEPELIALQIKNDIAAQQIKLTKSQLLPQISVGYNQQGFEGENYSGVFGALTIPLFGSRAKKGTSIANQHFQQASADYLLSGARNLLERQCGDYQLLLSQFDEYLSTVEGLNSDALLLKAYELGELSFLDYYVEMEFYRQVSNTMLEMEKQLQLLKADILKHQL